MKHSTRFSGRLLGLTFIVVMLFSSLASASPVPGINIVIKRNPGSIIARIAPDAKGNFRFSDLGEGKYEISIEGPADYFAAKALDKGKDIGASVNLSRSNIKRGKMKDGGPPDTMTAVNSSRSNIKRGAIKNSEMQNGLIRSTVDKKVVYSKVIISDIIIDGGAAHKDKWDIEGVINGYGIDLPDVK